MRFQHSLRYRVAVGFAALSSLVSLLFAATLYFAAHDVSQRLIDETLTAELDDYMARRERNPVSIPPSTVTVHGYVSAHDDLSSIPVELRQLQPGWHDLQLGETPYRVVVMDRLGERYFLLHDISLQERRENRFLFFLGGGVLLMGLLSAAIGFWFAGRVIAPVTELAQCVRSSSAEQSPVCLADNFPDDEVGELARVFESYISRLRAFVERERMLAADLSHELRTPLAVIQGATEVLLEDETLSSRHRERLERIERASHDMTDLGTALLLMAREESGETASNLCPVAEVLNESLDKHRYLIQNKSVELVRESRAPALQLRCERGLLYIVISNLLRNAFTYTEQGEVRVSLFDDRLVVEDTGGGIPARHQDQLFQRHFKGTPKGAGIGLSLVKRICDHYGWQIRLESREGSGTRAELHFPRDTPSAGAQTPDKQPA
ncbi:MAG: HAMP domain-containing sensor histidine kinase [Thiohalophilus sp.]|uniref:sensor histidine kinase n=1 Tax=Thiohalophilus sp. TaxID=3028392 RepID=UPI00286FE5EE|nr:HAMP domain-containing sensor histidine kinase [Thiohalophilus sp.]MDR9437607.1 HAMP domain-containing sensor histidine kinase [Thiohalophilus sp.]